MKTLGVYKNGNYFVRLLADGTKIRETNEDEFIPDDELLELFLSEMGSGGIHTYLTSYGHLLERTLEMARSKEKPITVELLELIKTKYFKEISTVQNFR